MKSRVLRVSVEFADSINRLRRRINKRIERNSGIKFNRKPVSNVIITRLLSDHMKPDKIVKGVEIKLKKNKVKLIDSIKWF